MCGVVQHAHATSGFDWRQDAVQNDNGRQTVSWAVDTVDGGKGWIVGSGDKIVKTENFGEVWSTQSSNLGSGYDWYGVDFYDDNTGWVVGSWAKVSLQK